MAGAPWAPAEREAHALPKFDPPGIEGGSITVGCLDTLPVVASVAGTPQTVGYPIVGFTVELDARHVKLRWGAGCGSDYAAPLEQFVWTIESQPVGSTAVLTNEATLAPRLRLDRPGTYQLTLTACPDGCAILQGGQTITVPPNNLGVTVEAVTSAPLAPETMPVVPPLPGTPPTQQARNNCALGSGVVGAQWFAVEQIATADDYEALEGSVTRSRVSRRDTPMNHFSQDFTMHVKPDPPYHRLLFAASDESELEVEWETDAFPEAYRPTIGDRVSIFGHWIYDCPHESKSEIHPPVGVVVHRARPIAVPPERMFPEFGGTAGTGVYVPGVVTDMFFSRQGGQLVDCSVDSGLRNGELGTGPNGLPVVQCLPPPSLDREFVFHIYLPRNPRIVMANAGFSVPSVPLYIADSTPPNEFVGPAPSIQRIDTAEGITYLRVTVDLRGYGPLRYVRRIVAGWVLPAADNWGLGRWRLLLNQLNVINDGDGWARGDGDWRLWVNTNNAASDWPAPASRQEWVQILNRDVNGVVTFGGQPWGTGLDASRSLGPDLLRYPLPGPLPQPRDYGILFHATGYEADTVTDDDAGTVLIRLQARAGSHVERNRCSNSTVFDVGPIHYYSGCVEYDAHFAVEPGPPLPRPTVSAGAQALAGLYVLSCARPSGGDDVGVCQGILAPPVAVPPIHPIDATLEPGSGAIDISAIGPFRPGEREYSLTEISGEDFYRIVEMTRRTDAERVDRMLSHLRRTLEGMLVDRSLSQDAYAELTMFRALLPRDLWTTHFGDLPRPPRDPDLPKAHFSGSGRLATAAGPVRVADLLLHCRAERQPNTLTVGWGRNHLNLDLALEASCNTVESQDRKSTFFVHEGRGIGRYNGVPGAFIEWRVVDGGEFAKGGDFIAVTVVASGAIVLQAGGEVVRGHVLAELK